MAICSALINGIGTSCNTNVGGIKKMYIADFDVVSYTDVSGEITAVVTETPTLIANATAQWSVTAIGGGAYGLNILSLPGNYTQYLQGGVTQVRATFFDGVSTQTITFPIIGATYNAGTNKTSITPDWISYGYQPITTQSTTITSQSVWIGSLFYEFQFNRGTSSYEETVAVDTTNGTTFFEQRITLNLTRRDKVKRERIMELTAGQKRLAVIVLDNNDIYWVFGIQDGVVLQEMSGGSGVQKADGNNYILTFVGQEREPAFEIDPTLVASVIVPA